jgi:hypothetical protein
VGAATVVPAASSRLPLRRLFWLAIKGGGPGSGITWFPLFVMVVVVVVPLFCAEGPESEGSGNGKILMATVPGSPGLELNPSLRLSELHVPFLFPA